MSDKTKPKESSARKKIDIWLNNLGWNTDEESPDCNVFTERLKTIEQQKKLMGKEPDYSLYKYGTDEIIGIIEAKRKGKDLDSTLKEAISKYAKPLDLSIIFVSDGVFVKTWHINKENELKIDGDSVSELLTEKTLLRFIKEGAEIAKENKVVKHSREQLMEIFGWANDVLRKEGIREGFERFIEFANILFLKLISEMELDREKRGEERILEEKYCWGTFSSLSQETMMEYINGTVLPYLVARYNHSGDVFQDKLQITNPKTLLDIVNKLNKLSLINAESDVKGDAFEYFLRNSVTVGNDLGEYFTPRHIVKLMVEIANPQFGEKIYDPTCGTGGFLIQAFNHIKRTCKLTPENLKILREETVFGRELTNTARIAKMNMIITGDGHTNIKQMDSLKYPVKEEYDVVVANPPYGQTTDWGDLYPAPSVQADSIFIQHIITSLNKGGRVVVIVPEGFLFRGGADKKTRKMLLNDLIAVISLPQGVFNPYTDSKTNIIVFQKEAKPTNKVWFYELLHDGFDLGKTRKPIDKNDIPDLKNKWMNRETNENCWIATTDEIKDCDYDLRVKQYKPEEIEDDVGKASFSAFIKPIKEKIQIDDDEIYEQVTVKLHGKGAILRTKKIGKDILTKTQYMARKGQLIVSKIDARNGAIAIIPPELDGAIVTSDFPLFNVDYSIIERSYLGCCIKHGLFYKSLSKPSKGTTNRKRIKPSDLITLKIHLPSKKEQKSIVNKILKLEAKLKLLNKFKNETEQDINQMMQNIDMI